MITISGKIMQVFFKWVRKPTVTKSSCEFNFINKYYFMFQDKIFRMFKYSRIQRKVMKEIVYPLRENC